MEDRKLENLFEAAKQVKLSPEEKSSSREILRAYMALTPARSAAHAPRARKAWSLGFVHLGRAASVLSLVVAMTLSVAGASYAAEGSLPGDVLYPVKVSVNEEVRAAFATSEVEKAKWESVRAERRLAEAEALAEKGALKAETRVELETRFKKHADRANDAASKIEDEEDEDRAAEVAAELGGSLDAHGKIIAAIAEERGNGEVVKLAAAVAAQSDIVARIGLEIEQKKEKRINDRRAHERREAEDRAVTEAQAEQVEVQETPMTEPATSGTTETQAVAPPVDGGVQVAVISEAEIRADHERKLALEKKMQEEKEEKASRAEQRAVAAAKTQADADARAMVKADAGAKVRREVAIKKIVEVRAYLKRSREKLGQEAVAAADARLTFADAAIVEGDVRLAAGEHRAAVAEYLTAQRVAQESKLLIRARVDLNVRVKLNVRQGDRKDEPENARDIETKEAELKEAEPALSPEPVRKETRLEAGTKVEADAIPEVKTEGSFRLRLFGR